MKKMLAASLLLFGGLIFAQAPPQAPKPAPELKRLHYFVGRWKTEADMKAGPPGPGGKMTSIDRNEMMKGGFFLVIHSDGKSPMGEMSSLEVLGYNADEKVYTFQGFDNTGMADTSKGIVKGDTWTWTSDSKVGGKTYKARFVIKEVSPTQYTFKYEMSPDGNAWNNLMEGKSTKIK